MEGVFIHPTAIIETDVTIKSKSQIWHYVHIRSGAILGENVGVGKSSYIGVNVKIGDNVKIQNLVSIYQGVIIASNVFIGPHVAFTNDRFPRIPNNNWKIQKTVVEEGVSIGANSTILCGIRLGKHSFIGAGSVVNKDVLPHALVVGNPIRQIGWICSCAKTIWRDKLPPGKNELKCNKC